MSNLLAGLATVLALTAAGLAVAGPAAADVVLLLDGSVLRGEVEDPDVVLRTPQAEYPVTRGSVWRILFNGTTDFDAVEFRNGSRIPGALSRGRFTVRLAGGGTRVVERMELEMISLAASAAPARAGAADVLILANGDHVYGEVTDTGWELWLPSGTQRFTREHVVAMILNGAVGDSVLLRKGGRLSGIVSHGAYTIRTPDGRDLRFARAEVKEVLLAGGAPAVAGAPSPGAAPSVGPPPTAPAAAPRPAPAAPGPPGPVAAAPGGPATPAVPAAALPAALRTALRDIHFAFDRSDLGPEARQSLDGLAEALKGSPNLTLLVEGHADERGTPEYNLALGARRAESAKAYLVSRGMNAARIATVSYGEERPLDPGHTEAAWALNRRAHFVVRQEP